MPCASELPQLAGAHALGVGAGREPGVVAEQPQEVEARVAGARGQRVERGDVVRCLDGGTGVAHHGLGDAGALALRVAALAGAEAGGSQDAAAHLVPVISQKPMAPSLEVARANLNACRDAGVPYLIHENWRWQTQLRELKRVLNEGAIGPPFRARISMVSSFPVYINEPQIKDLEEFILTDMGTHILDLARFLFGEAGRLYCQTQRVHKDNKGEDVASVMMTMGSGTTVTCEIGYPESPVECDYFPQTLVFVEGPHGTIEVARDYWVRVTTASGTHSKRYPPVPYRWVHPDYHVVHCSIVSCNANLLSALRAEGSAETTAEDNYKTLELVFAAYESSRQEKVIQISSKEVENRTNREHVVT